MDRDATTLNGGISMDEAEALASYAPAQDLSRQSYPRLERMTQRILTISRNGNGTLHHFLRKLAECAHMSLRWRLLDRIAKCPEGV